MSKILLALLIALPFIGWLLPADTFDDTGFELCPSKAFFDIECFGCGITRAVMHFHNFDWGAAAYYNLLVFAVYPLLVLLWYRTIRKVYAKAFTSL